MLLVKNSTRLLKLSIIALTLYFPCSNAISYDDIRIRNDELKPYYQLLFGEYPYLKKGCVIGLGTGIALVYLLEGLNIDDPDRFGLVYAPVERLPRNLLMVSLVGALGCGAGFIYDLIEPVSLELEIYHPQK